MYIVTGASGGIGKRVVEELAGRGHRVIGLCWNNYPDTSPKGKVDYMRYDLTNPPGIGVDPILNHSWGKDTDINFIHLAGLTINTSVTKTSLNDIQQQFDINCGGALCLVRRLWPRMKARQFGRLVFTGSVLAHRPVFGALGYSITKSAMEGMVRGLLPEGVKNNILPFGIGLGYTGYGMIEKVPDEYQQELKKTIPMGRFGNFKEVMNSIDFLIDTPYMAGQILHLNGGLHLA